MIVIEHHETRLVLGLLLALVLVAAAAPTASANGGPIVSQGSHGSIIIPRSDTDIWVNREVLRFRLSYGLTTASDEAAADLLHFAYGISGPWRNSTVAAARTLLPAEYSSLTANWVDPQPLFLNPISGQPYSPKHATQLEGGELRFAEFNVELGPGEETELRVSYAQPASVDRESVAAAWLRFAPITNYRYFLQPAKHWAGFEDLEITVITPMLVHTASSIPLRRTGWDGVNQVLQARLADLPMACADICCCMVDVPEVRGPGNSPLAWDRKCLTESTLGNRFSCLVLPGK